MASRNVPRILVVGSVNMDLVTTVEQFPRPGETVTGGDLKTIAGGKGANQAVAARRSGADVEFVGAVGKDAFGPLLIAGLEAEGIRVTHVKKARSASGIALIAVRRDGENILIHAPGANARVTASHVTRAASSFTRTDCVLLQREIPQDGLKAALEAARRHEIPAVFNPAPAPRRPLPRTLLSLASVLVVNETEAETLTGRPVRDLRQARTRTEELAQRIGGGCAILTLGRRGAWVMPPDARSAARIPAVRVRAVDATAAGDTFVGAFSTRYLETEDAVEAGHFAAAAAALAVTRHGAQPSIPRRRAIQSLLRRARG